MAKPNTRRPTKDEEDDIIEEDFENLVEESDAEENGEEEEEEEEIDQDEIDEDEFKKELQALARIKQPKKPIVNDEAGLLQKLEDIVIKLPGNKDVPWVETFSVTTTEPVLINDIQDDLERETTFYKHSLQAANQGLELMQKFKVPYKRPTDYFAEMLKSDDQMRKIKGRLIADKEKIEDAEEKRRQRDMKKFGKKVQQEKQQEKNKKKKDEIDAIKKWRKAREQGEAPNDSEFPIELDDSTEKPKSNNNTNNKRKAGAEESSDKPQKKKKMTKREFKNEKYGFGGLKRGAKRNNAESSREVKEYSAYKNKKLDPDMKKKMAKRTNNRPGKSKRQQRR